MRSSPAVRLSLGAALAITLACNGSLAGGGDAARTTGAGNATSAETSTPVSAPQADSEQTIDHLAPRPDSTGPTPTRFAWTPVKGADAYAIGLWNEVDVLVWRRDDLREPSVDWPPGFRLDPGTYFWSVTALRGGRPIAESGRAAFVVLELGAAQFLLNASM